MFDHNLITVTVLSALAVFRAVPGPGTKKPLMLAFSHILSHYFGHFSHSFWKFFLPLLMGIGTRNAVYIILTAISSWMGRRCDIGWRRTTLLSFGQKGGIGRILDKGKGVWKGKSTGKDRCRVSHCINYFVSSGNSSFSVHSLIVFPRSC